PPVQLMKRLLLSSCRVVNLGTVAEPIHRVIVVSAEETRVLARDDIRWCQSNGNSTVLHTKGEPMTARITMAALAAALGPTFVRVSRKATINIACLIRLRPRGQHAALVIELDDGTEIRNSRRFPIVRQLLRGGVASGTKAAAGLSVLRIS
ncbi:MAG TPA: LytTR family DNA-binding domain-containing protein, partial [Gemmatimonadaceae bacterium]